MSLASACKLGDMVAVSALIAAGADVNESSAVIDWPLPETPLDAAVYEEHFDVVVGERKP